MPDDNLIHKIAVSIIPNTGPVLIRRMISYLGSYEAIFREKKGNLEKIPGIGQKLAALIKPKNVFPKAEKELDYILKNNISFYFYLDGDYPFRLKNCEDAPLAIYVKGNINLNHRKVISVVGTRNATGYGREKCEELIRGIYERDHDCLIISGLAYGIDICAHKSALKYHLRTGAVLGHGLSFLYPSLHKRIAVQIEQQGGLVSEFPHNQKPEPPHFVKRNRIIAGLADATIVVESANKGGALITADMAGSYHRDVFAFPGRTSDKYSEGCNKLIKTNRAALIENIKDLEYIMGWEPEQEKPEALQKTLFNDLSDQESLLLEILKQQRQLSVDQICMESKLPVSMVSTTLLNLEFNGLVKCLPGKIYKTS